MLITLPFMPDFEQPMLLAKKTATSRTRKYGEVGDTFHAFSHTFVLIAILEITLQAVAINFYPMEGFSSPQEFIDCWKRIHPRRGWQPDQQIYFHIFRCISA